MGFDDDTGWDRILTEGWGPLVLAAVVERVERGLVGRRGVLVRALVDERASAGHAACVEEVHARIIEAIREETGADLDALGSQAAWACYDQVWGQLQRRWCDGGPLPAVPAEVEAEVVTLLRSLTPRAAQHAGADIGTVPVTPLRCAACVRVDLQGLFAYLARDRGEVTDADRALVDRLLALLRGHR